jgi:hypothetical protein
MRRLHVYLSYPVDPKNNRIRRYQPSYFNKNSVIAIRWTSAPFVLPCPEVALLGLGSFT